jgi:formamidopyrimidine-DNA glycosylase
MLGASLETVDRRAKNIIFTFSKDPDKFYVINHLAMSGGWLFRKLTEKSPIHTRLTLAFEKEGDSQAIDFVDPRHFGRLEFYTSEEFWSEKLQTKLSNFGPDALRDTITAEMLNQRIHDFTEVEPRWEIKTLLMDQNFIAGIGNIYSSEICFLAGINPFKLAIKLTQDEIKNLEEAIPEIIGAAYELGGTTIRTYKAPDGSRGWAERMIYGMKYCRLCKSAISKGPQSGRSTFWCSKCQPM